MINPPAMPIDRVIGLTAGCFNVRSYLIVVAI
jgi:hypothetical protein